MTSTAHTAGAPPHVQPLKTYFAVFFALLALTAITVGVSYFDFGFANLTIAVLVAASKATLVALYFMHLRHDSRLNAVVFGSSILLLFLFFFFTFADVLTRGSIDPQQGGFVERKAAK